MDETDVALVAKDQTTQIFLQSDQENSLKGRVETSVPAVCQRCLGAMRLPLQLQLDLLLAAGEAGDGQEVWELEDETVRPLDVIEESMIMAMPLAAMHRQGERCDAPQRTAETPSESKVRPFADLKAQLDGDHGE